MGSTPTSVITIGFRGFPYLARVRAALSSPIREASLLTCISCGNDTETNDIDQPVAPGVAKATQGMLHCVHMLQQPVCILSESQTPDKQV